MNNKQKIKDVSVPQWVGANSRILLTLIDKGADKNTVEKYLRYTAKMGDYFQVSDASSVMLLDEEHRKMVARESRQWDDIDGDKRYFYLEKDRRAKPQNSKGQAKKQFPMDNEGKPICMGFNSQAGCLRGWCNYSHICSVTGCYQPHTRFQHNNQQQFRNQAMPPFRNQGQIIGQL